CLISETETLKLLRMRSVKLFMIRRLSFKELLENNLISSSKIPMTIFA
ncbi:unnamed protein product, partial [marine sediment metagenome]